MSITRLYKKLRTAGLNVDLEGGKITAASKGEPSSKGDTPKLKDGSRRIHKRGSWGKKNLKEKRKSDAGRRQLVGNRRNQDRNKWAKKNLPEDRKGGRRTDESKGSKKGAGEGSRGGRISGHTKSGKPIYLTHKHENHKGWTKNDHEDARGHFLKKMVKKGESGGSLSNQDTTRSTYHHFASMGWKKEAKKWSDNATNKLEYGTGPGTGFPAKKYKKPKVRGEERRAKKSKMSASDPKDKRGRTRRWKVDSALVTANKAQTQKEIDDAKKNFFARGKSAKKYGEKSHRSPMSGRPRTRNLGGKEAASVTANINIQTKDMKGKWMTLYHANDMKKARELLKKAKDEKDGKGEFRIQQGTNQGWKTVANIPSSWTWDPGNKIKEVHPGGYKWAKVPDEAVSNYTAGKDPQVLKWAKKIVHYQGHDMGLAMARTMGLNAAEFMLNQAMRMHYHGDPINPENIRPREYWRKSQGWRFTEPILGWLNNMSVAIVKATQHTAAASVMEVTAKRKQITCTHDNCDHKFPHREGSKGCHKHPDHKHFDSSAVLKATAAVREGYNRKLTPFTPNRRADEARRKKMTNLQSPGRREGVGRRRDQRRAKAATASHGGVIGKTGTGKVVYSASDPMFKKYHSGTSSSSTNASRMKKDKTFAEWDHHDHLDAAKLYVKEAKFLSGDEASDSHWMARAHEMAGGVEHGHFVTAASKHSVPDQHQLKIIKDNVKNPLKAKFLGGPSVEESKKLLKEKFGWSDSRIKKLEASLGVVRTGKKTTAAGGEGSRGGDVVGHTKSGKPIYTHKKSSMSSAGGIHGRHFKGLTKEDHLDGIIHHKLAANKTFNEMSKHHNDAKDLLEKDTKYYETTSQRPVGDADHQSKMRAHNDKSAALSDKRLDHIHNANAHSTHAHKKSGLPKGRESHDKIQKEAFDRFQADKGHYDKENYGETKGHGGRVRIGTVTARLGNGKPFNIGDSQYIFHGGASGVYSWNGHQVGSSPMFIRGYDASTIKDHPLPKKFHGTPGAWYTYGSNFKRRAKDTPLGHENPGLEKILEREYIKYHHSEHV